MNYTKVIPETRNHTGFITMNCPDNLNAVDLTMAEELLRAFQEAERNPDIHVVVLRGNGPAFSAGGDIGYFQNLMNSGEYRDLSSEIDKVSELALFMKSMTKIIIASVHGAAAGAGASLAFASDLILSSDRARFLMAFVGLGLVPDTGGLYLMARSLGANRTMALCLTGEPLSAAEAHQSGLVYRICREEALAEETEQLASRLAAGPLTAYKNIKLQIREACFSQFGGFLQNTEGPSQLECSRTEDFREGVAAFMEQRKAVFSGK